MKLKIKQLDEMTVDQFQKVDKCLVDNGDCEFTNQYIISIVYDLPLLEVKAMRKDIVDQVSNEIKKVLSVDIPLVQQFEMNSTTYGFIPNIEVMSSGEYSDLESYITEPENYHKCMAVMYRPITQSVKDRYQIEKYEGTVLTAQPMKEAPAHVLKSALIFFYNLEKELLNASLGFIKQKMKELGKDSEGQKSNTLKNGGGISSLTTLQEEIFSELTKSQKDLYTSV